MGDFFLFCEGVDDFMNVLFAQTVFIAVFNKAARCVNHKHAAATNDLPRTIFGKLGSLGVFFVDHDNAGRNARAVKQVGRQPDNAFNETKVEQFGTDTRFGIAAKQHAVRQNNRTFAAWFQAFEQMQQKGVIAVFLRRYAVTESLKRVISRRDAARPVLAGKRRIGNGKIESFQSTFFITERWIGQGVAGVDFGGLVVVQNHIHTGKGCGRHIFFLTV